MSKGKIALVTVAFALVTFAVPFILLLIFVDADYISVYVAAFGLILALALGFIAALIMSVKKDLIAVVEEIKVQNAAIAYKLSKSEIKVPASDSAAAADVQQVSAAPAATSAHAPAAQENFDDFQ